MVALHFGQSFSAEAEGIGKSKGKGRRKRKLPIVCMSRLNLIVLIVPLKMVSHILTTLHLWNIDN